MIEGKEIASSGFIYAEDEHFKNLQNINFTKNFKTPQLEQLAFIKDIACGEEHSIILDDEDNIWTFGLNYNGQLGLGHHSETQNSEKIEKFTKNKIKKIESEGDISFAVTEPGEIFMWPIRNTKTGEVISVPRPVAFPEKIGNVACGGGFVLFLSVNGMVYSMGGSNVYGQLGHGDTRPRLKPALIEIFATHNERISQVSCGFKHCVAKSYKNKAYSWGLVNDCFYQFYTYRNKFKFFFLFYFILLCLKFD